MASPLTEMPFGQVCQKVRMPAASAGLAAEWMPTWPVVRPSRRCRPAAGDDVVDQVVLVAQAPGTVARELEPLVVQLHGGGGEGDLQHAGADAEQGAFLVHPGLEHGTGGRIRAQDHQPVVDLHERLLGVDVDPQLAAQPGVPGRVPVQGVATHRGVQGTGVLDGSRLGGGIERRAVGQFRAQRPVQGPAGEP